MPPPKPSPEEACARVVRPIGRSGNPRALATMPGFAAAKNDAHRPCRWARRVSSADKASSGVDPPRPAGEHCVPGQGPAGVERAVGLDEPTPVAPHGFEPRDPDRATFGESDPEVAEPMGHV